MKFPFVFLSGLIHFLGGSGVRSAPQTIVKTCGTGQAIVEILVDESLRTSCPAIDVPRICSGNKWAGEISSLLTAC